MRLLPTKASKHFLNSQKIPDEVQVFDDDMEWAMWKTLYPPDPVLHIEVGWYQRIRLEEGGSKGESATALSLSSAIASQVGRRVCDSSSLRQHTCKASQRPVR